MAIHRYVVDRHIEEDESAVLPNVLCTVCQRGYRSLRKEKQCILRYSMEQCSVSGCQHWFKSAGGISVHKFKDCVILLLLPNM